MNSINPSHAGSTNTASAISSDSICINDFIYRVAQPEDDKKLKTILRHNPMESWVILSFEREPEYFAADNLLGKGVTVIAERKQQATEVIGMYNCNLIPAFVDGRPEIVPYLGSLRVNPHYRNKIRILRYGYQSIIKLSPKGTVPLAFTSIASENSSARRILEANLKGMPYFRLLGEMHTLAISTTKGRNTGLLRPAIIEDIPALTAFYNNSIQQYQFAPALDEKWLAGLNGSNGLSLNDFWLYMEGDEIKACMAIWDQRSYKQTVVRGYRFPLNILRGAYNIIGGLMGWITFPPQGNSLQQVYLSFLAINENTSTDALTLIKEGLYHAREKAAKVAVIGLSEKNPLLSTITNAFPCHVYRTCIELMLLDSKTSIDVDTRPPQPEIAIL